MGISSIGEDKTTASVVRELTSRILNQEIIRTQQFGNGANSRVFRVEGQSGRQYVAKFYFRHPHDIRDRLNVEYSSLSFLWAEGIDNVPRPVAISPEDACAIYEFIEGDNITSKNVTIADINCAVGFLLKLKELTKNPPSHNLPPASEACFSIQAIIDNILQRLDRLYRLQESGEEYAELKSYLMNAIKPFLNILRERIHRRSNQLHIPFDKEIPLGQRTLSPSDFGFHNAVRGRNGRIAFLDFEYFGWDDPAKTIADFILHPAMALSHEMKDIFVAKMIAGFPENDLLAKRVDLVIPLYGIKWCLIFLNEFIPEEFSRRSYAAGNSPEKSGVLKEQLSKARNLYRWIKENYSGMPV